MYRMTCSFVAGVATLAMAASSVAAGTLDDAKAQGFFNCGVSQGLPGFSNADADGNWTGIDVDFCRALSAALYDDPQAVKFIPLSAKERFTALQSGEVDVLARNTTWTMGRDTKLGLNFTGVNFYDGQGFMVPKSLGVKSAFELDGASLCTNTGTTTELNAADFFRENNLAYEIVAFEKADEVVQAYDAGRCDVYTTDSSALYAQRLKFTDPDAHMVLPEIISKEPLGPVVRQGDDAWFNVNKWVHNAMLNAEEMGVNSDNVEKMKSSNNPAMRRLLGVEGTFGEDIALTNDWVVRIITHVGNYAETYNRNVGPDTPLGIARGVNALWTDGGLQYAPPVR